jgi:hypothetical protein
MHRVWTCKNIFTRNTLGLYYKLEIISSHVWPFQNFIFMYALIYLLNCWSKILFALVVYSFTEMTVFNE